MSSSPMHQRACAHCRCLGLRGLRLTRDAGAAADSFCPYSGTRGCLLTCTATPCAPCGPTPPAPATAPQYPSQPRWCSASAQTPPYSRGRSATSTTYSPTSTAPARPGAARLSLVRLQCAPPQTAPRHATTSCSSPPSLPLSGSTTPSAVPSAAATPCLAPPPTTSCSPSRALIGHWTV